MTRTLSTISTTPKPSVRATLRATRLLPDGSRRGELRQAVKVELFVQIQTEQIGRGLIFDGCIEQISKRLAALMHDHLTEEARFQSGRYKRDYLAAKASGFQTERLGSAHGAHLRR